MARVSTNNGLSYMDAEEMGVEVIALIVDHADKDLCAQVDANRPRDGWASDREWAAAYLAAHEAAHGEPMVIG